MDNSEPHPNYIAGDLIEYLSVSAGTVNDIPIGVLTFRLQNNKPINLMIKLLEEKLGRDDLCPCESGKRFMKCCLQRGCF